MEHSAERLTVGFQGDRSMTTYPTQYYSAAALFRMAAVMQAASRHLRTTAKSLQTWLEKRRRAAVAFDEFETMSERDLRDIGLSRADVLRVAWGASDRNCNPI
jgi:uncharacterized protein YjiS (DUF1127 family)